MTQSFEIVESIGSTTAGEMAAEQDQGYKETGKQGNQQSVKYTNYPVRVSISELW